MVEFVLDTSALLSLEAANLLNTILENFECKTTTAVKQELQQFAKYSDILGSLAKKILTRKISYLHALGNNTDDTLITLSNQEHACLITDDVKLSWHSNIQSEFSVYFLTALIKKKKISHKKAEESLEQMRVIRNWQSNIIYWTAKEDLRKSR